MKEVLEYMKTQINSQGHLDLDAKQTKSFFNYLEGEAQYIDDQHSSIKELQDLMKLEGK